MALTGNLADLSIADLVQIHCQAGSVARLSAWHSGQQIDLYFAGGEVVHASGAGLQGEQAVYALFGWDDGTFEVVQNVAAPQQSITIPWSALVLEGFRLKDEAPAPAPAPPPPNPLHQALHDIAAGTSFDGLILLSRDGLVLAAELPGKLDPTRTGAVAAGLLSLSGRSVAQLSRGDLLQTLVQGSNGNLIITQAGPHAALLALADPAINLGLAFLEARESAQALADLVQPPQR